MWNVYERGLARARSGGDADAPDASQPAPDAGSAPVAATPPDAPRLRLRGVLDRMSVSSGFQLERESWRAGVRLRYSRSVEFDAATDSYALLEASEIAPAARFRVVATARPMRVVVRRTGYGTWEQALFAPPSRWLFLDRPNQIEEARQLAPGTEITMSSEAKFFLGADDSTGVGTFPLGFQIGAFVSGEYFVRLTRLPAKVVEPPGDREWTLSVGGLITNGFESAFSLRTPELLLGKRVRVLKAHSRLPSGARFLLRAGPLDLVAGSGTEEFFRAVVGGAAIFRLSDFGMLGRNLEVAVSRPEIGLDLLRRMEMRSHFRRVLDVAARAPETIPCSESVSRFTPRRHGEFGVGAWALVYGFNFSSAWYSEESLGARPNEPPRTIWSFPFERRWDRGWLLFPRETHDLQMVTVKDGQSDDLVTEVSLEIEDAHAHEREGRVYRAQIARFLTRAGLEKFRMRSEAVSPVGPQAIQGELPDLFRGPTADQRVSIYLRLILGPRHHERLLSGSSARKDWQDRITAWQRQLSTVVRRRGDLLEELVRTYGADELFVSYRIALTPYFRRKESPRPTIVYSGSFGDPEQVPSYRRLRDTFDTTGTLF